MDAPTPQQRPGSDAQLRRVEREWTLWTLGGLASLAGVICLASAAALLLVNRRFTEMYSLTDRLETSTPPALMVLLALAPLALVAGGYFMARRQSDGPQRDSDEFNRGDPHAFS